MSRLSHLHGCVPKRTCFFLNTTFEKIGPVKRRVTAATRTTTENIYQGQAWYVLGLGKVGSLVWFALPKDSFGMDICWNIKCFSGSVFEEWIFMYKICNLIRLSHEWICFFVCILRIFSSKNPWWIVESRPLSQDPHSSIQMEVFRMVRRDKWWGGTRIFLPHHPGDLCRNHGAVMAKFIPVIAYDVILLKVCSMHVYTVVLFSVFFSD